MERGNCGGRLDAVHLGHGDVHDNHNGDFHTLAGAKEAECGGQKVWRSQDFHQLAVQWHPRRL
jgi:hypothetical protein